MRKCFTYIFSLMLFASSSLSYAQSLPDFTHLIEHSSDAVVNISTTSKAQETTQQTPDFGMPDIPEDNPMHDFLKKFFGDHGGNSPHQQLPRSSLGSGFVISKDGYVITNNHVIKEADEIIVRLSDRREFVAEVVGKDARSDLAILKIDANDLPVVKLGDSSKLKVGEWVLAIGSPFGFDHSVTAGIVSAKGRSLPNENYVPFIQTDVAINPGNSGGPLFNMQGEVVGVNSQIFSRTGGFMGLSFAIPVDVVRNVYEQIRETGRVDRGWLGVLIQDVTRELAESFGMDKPQGALVAKVLEESPAAEAGLEAGDIILNFNGQDIDLSSDLPPVVGSTPINRSVPVEILRNGATRTLKVKIGPLPKEGEIQIASASSPESNLEKRLKLQVKTIPAAEQKKLGLEGHGVLVEKVEPGVALEAGIRPGDILLLLDNIKVESAERFMQLASDLKAGKSVPILIQRRGSPIFLALKVPQ